MIRRTATPRGILAALWPDALAVAGVILALVVLIGAL